MKTNLLSKLCIGALLIGQAVIAQSWKWAPLTSGTSNNLNGVQFLDANNGYACGDNGTVLKTTDGGATWNAVNISTSYPVRQVSFTSTTQGWAAVGDPNNYTTSGALYVTADGGTTWTPVTWPGSSYANLSVQFFSATSGYLGSTHYTAGTGTDTYYTSNGGTTWASNPSNIDWNWIYDMSFLNATTGWSVGDNVTNGSIFYTNNGGTTWTSQNSTTTFYYGIDFKSANVGYVVGASGTILATTNGGINWNAQTSGTAKQLNGVSFASTTTGWAAGDTGIIVMTSNGGTAWGNETSGTSQNINAITCLDSNTAWAVGNGGVILKREFTTGINEVNKASAIHIYPNPSTGIFTLEMNSENRKVKGEVEVYNMLGEKVYSHSFISHTSSFKMDVSNLPSGTYLVKVSDNSDNRAVQTRLIVIR